MTRLPTLSDATLGLGLPLVVGALAHGWVLGLQAALCGALALGNLAVHRALVGRITADLAAGGDGGPARALLGVKLVGTLLVVAVLLSWLHPVALVLGLSAALGAALLRAARSPSHEEASA